MYICEVIATDSFTSDTDYLKAGYIRVDEDTNRGAGGNFVFIWYRQTTDPQRALTDLKVSINDEEYQRYQQENYTPVSVNLNQGTQGSKVYLWYKTEVGEDPIKTIILLLECKKSTVRRFERAGITVIEKDLNDGNQGHCEYLCVYQ